MKSTVHLILIRGLARESRHWGSFIDDLRSSYKKLGVEVRVDTIDLPGCGRHSEMHAMISIDKMADFSREKMKEILEREANEGIEPATHRRLIAISLGGMVATSWLARFPSDFQSAVLINSSFRNLSKIRERLLWTSWWRAPGILTDRDVESREEKILKLVSNDETKRRLALPKWIAIAQSRPVSSLNLGLQLVAAARFQAPQKLPVPLLVLSSRRDRMVDCACSKAIAKQFGAKIEVHPTAGHDLTLDDGPWAAEMIAKWNQNSAG